MLILLTTALKTKGTGDVAGFGALSKEECQGNVIY